MGLQCHSSTNIFLTSKLLTLVYLTEFPNYINMGISFRNGMKTLNLSSVNIKTCLRNVFYGLCKYDFWKIKVFLYHKKTGDKVCSFLQNNIPPLTLRPGSPSPLNSVCRLVPVLFDMRLIWMRYHN